MRPHAMALFVVLAMLAGCRFTEPEEAIDTPPLWYRSQYPAEGAPDLADVEDLTLIVRFRNEFEPSRITTLRIVPPPLSRGETRFDVSREVQIDDVVLDPSLVSHFWILDGPDMVHPVVLELFTQSLFRAPGFVQARVTKNGSEEEAVDSLVFVLVRRAPASWIPDSESRMLNLPIVKVQRVRAGVGGTPGVYVDNLPPRAEYVLVVVEDTNRDGRYEPGVDWWGYPYDSALPNFPLTQRAVSIEELEGRPSPADIRILPPNRLNPMDFQGPIASD